jgi:hypothetical protein
MRDIRSIKGMEIMNTNANGVCAALTLAVSLLAAAPAAAEELKFGDYTAKGFLSDYSKLAPEGGDSKAFKHRDPAVDFTKYDKLLIDRIQIFANEDSEYKGVDPAELKELVDYFHEAIKNAVADAYPVVREPGPDVLRLRITVTDLVPNKPEASVVSLVVPFVWVAEAGAGAAEGEVGSTPFVGEATVEMEAMDSVSARQVAAYIETRVGKKYAWSKGIATGVDSYTKAYSTWAYTKQSFDFWAGLIRERLDAVRAR